MKRSIPALLALMLVVFMTIAVISCNSQSTDKVADADRPAGAADPDTKEFPPLPEVEEGADDLYTGGPASRVAHAPIQTIASIGTGPGMAGAAIADEAIVLPHGGTSTVNDAAFDAMFFENYGVNPYIDADEDNLSTFAVDVDTGSYTLCRGYLERGAFPEPAAVRVEEFVNYFDYGYAEPTDAGDAFAIHLEAAPSPFAENRLLLRVGLQGREVKAENRKPAVLTVVIDVSGSMNRENRLELVKKSLLLLVDQMEEGDEIGIAVYGSQGQEFMTHKGVDDREAIIKAINSLASAGSTNAEQGLIIGYQMAQRAYREDAINRLILCSDGVANVGSTGPETILKSVGEQAQAGITLSTIGFGMGNYNDVLMEQLADNGDGNYAYVDRFDEAKRVFVENLTGMLQVIAGDTKVQVEFNPGLVRSYRLIGYENRDVADEDFRNDEVDAGEVGAGHSVTALYEIRLWDDAPAGELATVRLRYEDVEASDEVYELAETLTTLDVAGSFDDASESFQLAACVMEFAELLRKSYWAKERDLGELLAIAEPRLQNDERETVQEFLTLIATAKDLDPAED